MTGSLPRIFVPYKSHHLSKNANGDWKWITKIIEVEVVTLNLRTGTMRVRSVEKIAWSENEKAQIRSFDLSDDDFFKVYELVKK